MTPANRLVGNVRNNGPEMLARQGINRPECRSMIRKHVKAIDALTGILLRYERLNENPGKCCQADHFRYVVSR